MWGGARDLRHGLGCAGLREAVTPEKGVEARIVPGCFLRQADVLKTPKLVVDEPAENLDPRNAGEFPAGPLGGKQIGDGGPDAVFDGAGHRHYARV